MTPLTLNISDKTTVLSGDLNSATVATISSKHQAKIVNSKQMTLDLSDVKDVDTAGLAWLLYLVEQALNTKCQLTFAHLPDDLLKLAQLSAVDDFLMTA
ncbi:lipid asymmetry maintenance protein MlaB [Thalassotalea euphylliae]|uniref:STAS domain-containing protein n=1 Tax=Thalassotalea euphylliae TaxID=1655234 RepID=UPI00363C29BD